ncbi:MAG: signal peptidase I [Spirochaetia bacterium]|nr:signal peptidase I [Spirochaetia bacterium]
MLKYYYHLHETRRKVFEKFPSAAALISLAGIIVWVLVFKSMVLSANNIPTGSMIPTLKIGDFLFVNRMRYGVHIPFTDINILKFDKPERGDIVVFIPPARAGLEGKTLVKRIIGVPGDEVFVKDDEIFVNGTHYPVTAQTDRAILSDIDYPGISKEFTENDLLLFKEKVIDPKTFKVKVEHYILKQKPAVLNMYHNLSNPDRYYNIPEGKYMMMGDNRDDSDDSRRWEFVNDSDIHGKVFMIYFSVDWGSRYFDNESSINPFINLFRLVSGKLNHVAIRWNRIGSRIF